MAQLYIQKNAQPDTWVMSGAPTATTVFLSLDADINYSDGTSDTLPANTLAVLPDASTVFDRTHDVYVCYTVQTSRVLSVIKESLLPTLTSAYAPLCRIELHGIKPYQPEPYLTSGGLGGGPAGTPTVVGTAAGAERVYAVGAATTSGALGSEPAGWQTAAFADSGWALSVAETDPDTVTAYGAAPSGGAWVTYQNGSVADGEHWLLRKHVALPAGALVSCTLTIKYDDGLVGAWMNGSALAVSPRTSPTVASTADVPLSLLTYPVGSDNVLAIEVVNGWPPPSHGGDTALACTLTFATTATPSVPDPGGHEGDLLSYHSGAWTDLPIGTSGQELTVVSGAPAWATPPAGGTLTSVALAGPTGTTVSGSPVTGSGTLTLSWSSQSANTVLAGPTGSSGAPTFRALVGADIPVDASTIISSAGTIKGNYQAGSGVSISGNTITATGSGGSVTSVALTVPGFLSVSGSPITTSGTFALTLANESANTVFAGPSSGSAAAPTFRGLAAGDLPAAAAAGGHIHAHIHLH